MDCQNAPCRRKLRIQFRGALECGPVLNKFGHGFSAMLWAFENAMDASEQKLVREFRVRIRVENIARAYAYHCGTSV